MGFRFDMLCNQCMELRQATLAAQCELTADLRMYRSNRRAFFPLGNLVVGPHRRVHYFFGDHVDRREVLFAFPHDYGLLWCVCCVASIRLVL